MKITIFARMLVAAAIPCSVLALSPAAYAQGTFTPGTGTATNCNPSASPIQSFSCTVGSVSVTMSAWGYMDSSNGWKQGLIGDFDSNGIGAYTGKYETSASSQHAFDNVVSGCGTTSASGASGLSALNSGCGGSIEALLLNFGSSSVSLTQLGIGYYSGDADVSVYRWTGGAGGPTLGTVDTTGTGTIAGWTLVGSKDLDSQGNSWAAINSAPSSYFLITTYFGAASGSDSYGGQGLVAGNDKFKINSFTVAKAVPEPATLALASLGFVAAIGVRRRGNRKAS